MKQKNKNSSLVWSSEGGDRRKKSKAGQTGEQMVDEASLILQVRRLTSGKGRAVIEIKGLPTSSQWCKHFAKELKNALGVGGTFKKDYIEVHGEKLAEVIKVIEARNIRWKKTGG